MRPGPDDSPSNWFLHEWRELASRWFGPGRVEEVGAYLLDAYSAPARKYHGVYHVLAMLDRIRTYEDAFIVPDAARAAAFFHDVVYDPARQDNEEQSVRALHACFAGRPLDFRQIGHIENFILATDGKPRPLRSDAALFVDVDRAVLGDHRWPAYARYARGIWDEYVPVYGEEAYRRGRIELFLDPLIRAGRVFLTDRFGPREADARANLSRERGILAAGETLQPGCEP